MIISLWVLTRIKFKRPKKHVATMMTRCLREIFLVKAFSFKKREANVYVLKRDTCIKHKKKKKILLVSCVPAAPPSMPARYAKMPLLEPCLYSTPSYNMLNIRGQASIKNN
jgi:hypothetical protein